VPRQSKASLRARSNSRYSPLITTQKRPLGRPGQPIQRRSIGPIGDQSSTVDIPFVQLPARWHPTQSLRWERQTSPTTRAGPLAGLPIYRRTRVTVEGFDRTRRRCASATSERASRRTPGFSPAGTQALEPDH